MSLLNIGMSGLAASSSSLATTGNNIANVDTAGYSRQQTVQGTKSSQQYGTVFIGTGTTLADVRRVYNSYLESQLHTATSLDSESAAFLKQATPLDSTLSDTNTGLTGVLQKFFTTMQGVSTSATDDTSRQSVLTGAQTDYDTWTVSFSQNLYLGPRLLEDPTGKPLFTRTWEVSDINDPNQYRPLQE